MEARASEATVAGRPRREKGTGSLFLRADGLWTYSANLGIDPTTGKRNRRVLYAKTKAALKRKIADISAVGGGVVRPRRQKEPGTVGAFLERWLNETIKPNRARATFALYEGIIAKHVTPIIGNAPIATFGPDEVAELYKRLREAGTGASVMNSASRILHAAFEARHKRNGASNPFDRIERPRHHAKEVRPFTASEAARFLDVARESPIEPLFALCLTAGLRIGEALAIRWSDIDLDARTVTIERALTDVSGYIEIGRTKTTRSRRVVPLSGIAIDALKRRRELWAFEGHGSDLVITGPSGKALRPSFVRTRYLQPILSKAKLKGTIHGLRHAFSTLLAEAGTPLKTISTTMGHAKSSITLDTYQHTDPTAQRAAIDRLEMLLAKSDGHSNRP
jgi:integrase